MKVKYKIILLFACLNFGMKAFAQEVPLALGAQAPAFSLTVYDGLSKQPQLKTLDNYQGQWLVLDFWSKTCSACIKGFPKLDNLTQKYKGKINFILIGSNDKKYNEGIEKMYKKLEKASNLSIDNAFDTLMLKPYSVYALPHVVIIDPQGVVQAITYGSELTDENLDGLISGKGNNFAMNIPVVKAMPKAKVIEINDSVGREGYQSIISQWRKSDGMKIRYELSSGFLKGSYQTMASLERLYLIAYFGAAQWNSDHPYFTKVWPKAVFELTDSSAFLTNLQKQQGYYNYNIKFADTLVPVSLLQKAMQQDLDKHMDYAPRIEKRNMPIYILTAEEGAAARLKSKFDKKNAIGDYSSASFHHYLISDVISMINMFHAGKVFIDETEIDIPIDIKLDTNLTDFEQLRLALLKEGIRLELGKKMMDVLVISRK